MKQITPAKSISYDMRLEEIEPAIAWQTWEPSNTEPWDRRNACLLHRRAGFGVTTDELKETLSIGHEATISKLMHASAREQNAINAFELESAVISKSVLASSDIKQLAAWWLHRMLNSPTPLVEKMTLFWHGHFATGGEKVLDAELMHTQNELLRENALGNFQNLVQGIAKDPAMLIYLDSVSNRKAHANENFARELMELFCLGEGNYTEADVQQLAKCFTGWEIRRKQFRFNSYQHDDSLKTILGKNNIESGEAAIESVLASPHMASFIARKLFGFFVCEDFKPSDELLASLADRFVETNYSIASVVEMILRSRVMLSGWSIGRKVRSPIELSIGWMRTLKCTTNIGFLAERLRTIGQALFFPPNVKGWEGGRAWINSSTLVGRANLIFELINHENTRFDGTSLQAFVGSNHIQDKTEFASWFTKMFFVQDLSGPELNLLSNPQDPATTDRWASQTMIALASQPKIHLS